MNKKLIIIIASSVAVLVIAVVGALWISGKINLDFSSKDSKEGTSSVSKEEKNDTKSTKDSEEVNSSKSGQETGSKTSSSSSKTEKSGSVNVDKGEDIVVSNKNEIVTIPVKISNNPGMVAGQVFVEYDTKSFDFAECTAGDIFEDCQSNAKDGTITCIALEDIQSDSVDSTKNGTLFNIVLKPKSNIKAGTYSLKITDKTAFANLEEQYVYPTVSIGNIIIK